MSQELLAGTAAALQRLPAVSFYLEGDARQRPLRQLRRLPESCETEELRRSSVPEASPTPEQTTMKQEYP